MMPAAPSENIVLSQNRVTEIRTALEKLANFIPDIDRMKACDAECQEIADMAAHLQTKLTAYLHSFGGGQR